MAAKKFRRFENGFGSISELPGNRRRPFRARKTVGYNEKRQAIYENVGYYATYTEALEGLIEYNRDPYDLSKKDTTIGEVLDLWLAEQKPVMAANSYRAWKTSRKKLAAIEDKPMKSLRTAELQEIIDSIEHTTARGKAKRLLTHGYKYAIGLDLGVRNYAESLVIKPAKETKVEKIEFTADEIRSIYSKVGTGQVFDMAMISLCTGMRPTEVVTLDKEKIDLEAGLMTGGIKTPAGIDRTIPISRHIAPILSRYMENGRKYLFYNTHRNRLTSQNYQDAMRRELDHSPHECRHTFSSNFYRTDVDRPTIKKIFGHKAGDVTEDVYVHKTDEELIAAMAQFDAFMDELLCL